MARRIALILAAVLSVYLFFAASRGIDLIRTDDPAVQALGVAVLILPILGAFLVIREIRFGKLSYQMGQVIDEAYLPAADIAADQKNANLVAAIDRAKEDMDNWQAWYSVALAYELMNERKLAREAMRYSVELFQAANPK